MLNPVLDLILSVGQLLNLKKFNTMKLFSEKLP